MTKDLVSTLLRFAVRAGKIVLGYDNICYARKKIFLIICCDTASERTKRNVLELSKSRSVPIVNCHIGLDNVINKSNCKVLALTDKQMSEAALKNLNENYSICFLEE